MKSDKGAIVTGYIIITLIWSSTWYFIKLGLPTVPPFFGVAFRFSLATIIFAILVVVRKEKMVFTKAAIQLYAILGLLSFSIPFALVYFGEQYIPSGLASILYAGYPFVVAIGSHLLLPNEKLNTFKVAGIFTGFVGLLIIFWSDFRLDDGSAVGIGALVLSTIISGSSLVLAKRSGMHLSPLVMNLGGMLFAIPTLYIISFATEKFSDVHPDANAIISITYLGTVGTVATFVIYYWLLKRIEVLYLSLVTMMTPVIAVVLGAVMLNETLSVRTFAGSAFVLLGVLITHGKELHRRVTQQAVVPLQGGDSIADCTDQQ